MPWVAAISSTGAVTAVGRTTADVAVPTGGQVIEVNHPVERGYSYDTSTQTFSARSEAGISSFELLRDIPTLMRERFEEIHFAVFASSALNNIRIYIDHMGLTVNCALDPRNRDTAQKIGILRREMELDPNRWIEQQSGWSSSGAYGSSGTYYTTVVPTSATGAWTRASNTLIVRANPPTYTGRDNFVRAYAGRVG